MFDISIKSLKSYKMKIAHLDMATVKEGVNPFTTLKWSDATEEKQAEVYEILSCIGSSRQQA